MSPGTCLSAVCTVLDANAWLVDLEEAVVARVISSLTSLASLGLLPRMRLWDVFFAVKGFLCHPNTWIRQGKSRDPSLIN